MIGLGGVSLTQVIARETHLLASDYGMVGDGVTLNDPTALYTELAQSGAPSKVDWMPGHYLMSAPFGSQSYVKHCGPAHGNPANPPTPGYGAKLTFVSTNMFDPTSIMYGIGFEDIMLEVGAAAPDLIALGTLGGLVGSSFDRVYLNLNNTGSSIMSMANGVPANNLFDIDFNQCHIERLVGHTVPAFVLLANSGTSHIRFKGGYWHSHGCTSSPFFKAENDSNGAFVGAFDFNNITGEQNAGGMIHLGSIAGGSIEGCVDYDQSLLGAYQDDLFKFYKTAGGNSPQGFSVYESGTNDSAAGFAAGKGHLNITDGGATRYAYGRIRNGNSDPVIKEAGGIGRIGQFNGGLCRPYRTVTGTYTANTTDCILDCNSAAAFNLTIPTGSTVPAGYPYFIMNRGAGTVTVAPAAGTISGAASVDVAQGQQCEVFSNGGNWFGFVK